MSRRVGIIGYGNLGKYIVSQVLKDDSFELAFVWNRTKSNLSDLDPKFVLDDIADFARTFSDIVVEVAHPSITECHGKTILNHCDYMVGSPTALCDENLFNELRDAAKEHGLYVPSGAFWGAEDIRKIADAGQLQALTVTMRKHPSSLKLEGYLSEINAAVTEEAVTLYQGPVRNICRFAPHNTNTMAVGAVAASNLGFDSVVGCLVADPKLTKYHVVQIEASGYPRGDGTSFHVNTVRRNPAELGAVTGQATYAAYVGSLKRAQGKGPGVHLC